MRQAGALARRHDTAHQPALRGRCGPHTSSCGSSPPSPTGGPTSPTSPPPPRAPPTPKLTHESPPSSTSPTASAAPPMCSRTSTSSAACTSYPAPSTSPSTCGDSRATSPTTRRGTFVINLAHRAACSAATSVADLFSFRGSHRPPRPLASSGGRRRALRPLRAAARRSDFARAPAAAPHAPCIPDDAEDGAAPRDRSRMAPRRQQVLAPAPEHAPRRAPGHYGHPEDYTRVYLSHIHKCERV